MASTLEPLLDARETARFLGIGLNTLRIATREGAVPSYRIGRAVRYRRSDLELWLEHHRQGTTRGAS
jgi:excisionase family DNA binding protein